MEKRYEIGNFIYQLRTERGYTQKELGALLGVTDKAVSKWETGAALPRMEVLRQLAIVLGCTQEELFLGRRIRRTDAPDAEPEMDISAEYKEVMKRCDCCRHEGMKLFALLRSASEPNECAVCKKCGAELRLERGSKVWYNIGLFILRKLVLFFGVFGCMIALYADPFSSNPAALRLLYSDETREAYMALYNHQQIAQFNRIERIKDICVLLVLLALMAALEYGFERLLEKWMPYRKHLQVVRYPHPEDGKIVF